MAGTIGSTGTGWTRGKVKAVPSGDSLVITIGNVKEKTITLSALVAPQLARRGGVDEPFAWGSREFLRNICIGKEVTFKVDYAVHAIEREYGTVFLGYNNVAKLVVSAGWAKVREPMGRQQKEEVSSYLGELFQLELQAKEQGLGCWTKIRAVSSFPSLSTR